MNIILVLTIAVWSVGAFLSFGNNQTELTVGKVINRAASNENKIRRLNCRFKLHSGVVETEAELSKGVLSKTKGNANGKWVIDGEIELFEFVPGDIFETKIVKSKSGEQSMFVPFPGGQHYLRNQEYVLKLGDLLKTATIGMRDLSNFEMLYHPHQCLGAIGSEQYSSPFHWYIDPPLEMTHKINEEGSQIHLISEFSDGSELTTEFDKAANYMLKSCKLQFQKEFNSYRVSETYTLSNGSFIPKRAYAIFGGDQENLFPAKVAKRDQRRAI